MLPPTNEGDQQGVMRKKLLDRMNRLQRDIRHWSCAGLGGRSHADRLQRLKERADRLLETIKQELEIPALEENLDYARNPYNRLWVDGKLVPHTVAIWSDDVKE